ncbi:hypothetical protein COLSTE_01122, partial [Collinsella stercoris DSM 13279]
MARVRQRLVGVQAPPPINRAPAAKSGKPPRRTAPQCPVRRRMTARLCSAMCRPAEVHR